MEYYRNLVRGLDDAPVRADGEYEGITLPYPFEDLPTYGLFFDEVYNTPLAMPNPKRIPPSQQLATLGAFQNPNANSIIPMVINSRSNNPQLIAYDSPGPGIVRRTPVFTTSSYSNPLVGPKSLPPIVRR